MSENLKTIKELADELGVSKQTIHYHIKSLSNIKRDKNNKGAVLLNEEEQKFIYSKVNAVKDDTVKDDTVKDNTVKGNTVKDNTVKGNTAHFLSEIQFLRTQLENKDTQILQMQNLLDQQQRLALQDKKLLEEYKSEIQSLKALTTEDNKAHSEEHSEDANIGVKDKSKRWWRFGK